MMALDADGPRLSAFVRELDSVMASVGVSGPARLRHDASELVKSGVAEVRPRVSEEGGAVSLHGTVAISYHGSQYNIPIEVSLPSYPAVAPICFVRPTPDMMIRSRHRNVHETSGRIALAYLRDWSHASTLVDLCAEMASVFSTKPPLFAKPQQQQQQQRETTPPAYEATVRDLVTERVRSRLESYYQKTRHEIDDEFRAQQTLQKYHQRTHAKTNPTEMRDVLQAEAGNVEIAARELEAWIEAQGKIEPEIVPKDPLSRQLLDTIAEIHAIDDLLFALDTLLADSTIDLDAFLREVRKLATMQFKLKALVFKIHLAIQEKLAPAAA